MRIADYITAFDSRFPFLDPSILPWQITPHLSSIVERLAASLSASSFQPPHDGVFIHYSAIVEPGAVIKGPAVISDGCYVAATAYVRGGVFLDQGVTIGPGCEVKSTIIMAGSNLAHFNFVGDSIVGSEVNLEAGAVVANHHNDRDDKEIRIYVRGKEISTGVEKFGAVIADRCRVGANAVLAPGTVLEPSEVVGRLVLVNQGPE